MTFPALTALVPHRPPMLLLDSVVAFEPGQVSCRAYPRADSIFAQRGSLPAIVALEYMAQATAVLTGLAHQGSPLARRPGLLAGVRGLWLARDTIEFDTALTVRASVQTWTTAAGVFKCTVELQGETIAAAQLTVVVGSEPVVPR